jgi:hypothetical protein
VTPLAPHDIRARRRPKAVVFVYLTELAWALIIATPVHAWARRVWGAHPDGDGVLFRSGARELLVWLGQEDAALGVTTRTTLLLLIVGAVVMQLPLGALLTSLAFVRDDEPIAGGDSDDGTATEPPSARRSLRLLDALRAAVGTFLPLSGVLAIGAVTALVVLGGGVMASSAVDTALTERLGDARAFQVGVVVVALFAALAAVLGVVLDLARAGIARASGIELGAHAQSTRAAAWSVMLRSVKAALRASRRGLPRTMFAWGWRAAIGLALVGVGAFAAERLGGHGGASLGVLFAIHQLVVLARVALRASWLARALAIVSPVQDNLVQHTRDAVPPPSAREEARAEAAPKT